mmetsp:Transcript_4253/g.8605  ORF Transcript_4253/g.8605 Transcript_4253/m.8605 type:complete len:280 (-) Transcript_4253:66-905(-)
MSALTKAMALKDKMYEVDPKKHKDDLFDMTVLCMSGKNKPWKQESRTAWLLSQGVSNITVSRPDVATKAKMMYCLSGQGPKPHDLTNKIFDNYRASVATSAGGLSELSSRAELYERYCELFDEKYADGIPQGIKKKSESSFANRKVMMQFIEELETGDYVQEFDDLTMEALNKFANLRLFGKNKAERAAVSLSTISNKFIELRQNNKIDSDGVVVKGTKLVNIKGTPMEVDKNKQVKQMVKKIEDNEETTTKEVSDGEDDDQFTEEDLLSHSQSEDENE